MITLMLKVANEFLTIYTMQNAEKMSLREIITKCIYMSM